MIGQDIQSAADPLQSCAGHEAGCEAAVHAMKEIQELDETILLSIRLIDRQLCIISKFYVLVYQLC